ncbi:MAG: chromosome partitioning protein ParB [Alphaproteobacteria bacterium CG_4_9_14_3_um_filter_47_13]|nr:MAG: chromosome partitioning protein ParB [Alphaproteobacteria bacterium CG_4_9_14_3_um_filter_47_13]
MNERDENDVPDPKKRGLGRGLNALFGDEEEDLPSSPSGESPSLAGTRQMMVGVDQLEAGSYQPRRTFTKESLSELSESITIFGVLQPLIVRKKSGFDGMYEIIAGERRWRAAQQAQIHEVPVIVKKLSDQQALEIALIENLQREDLNPVEEAQGYRRLMEEFGHTQEKAAKVLGKSRSHVANTLRLLNLPRRVLDMITDGTLSAGHARTLITAKNPEELADMIANQGLSVRDAEKLTAEKSGRTATKAKARPEKDVNTIALEEELANSLGMKVLIDMHKDGQGGRSGSLKVSFKTLDDLDDLLRRLSHRG